jgi:hypothetical protein
MVWKKRDGAMRKRYQQERRRNGPVDGVVILQPTYHQGVLASKQQISGQMGAWLKILKATIIITR